MSVNNANPRGKKRCPECENLVGTRTSTCKCGHVFSIKKTDKTAMVFSITDKQIRVVLEVVKRLDQNPDLTSEILLNERKEIDLNTVIKSTMKADEIKKIVRMKEQQEKEKSILYGISKRDLSKIIYRVKE